MADLTLSEEWRIVSGFPDYEVSSFGRVRRATDAFNQNGLIRHKGALLNPSDRSRGYFGVTLYRDKQGRTMPVHRLVCRAFHGQPPTAKHLAAHNDGDPTNNHESNLRWATYQENYHDAEAHGRRAKGERSGHAKITEAQVLEIRRRRVNGETHKVIAKDFGISLSAVNHISLRRNWAWLI